VSDRGDDSAAHREALRMFGIRPVIAKRRVEHGSGLGRWRWVIERSIAWLHQYRRVAVRWDYRADIHHGFLTLACCLICWRCLKCFAA
jgi:transposase